jgi:hypothetical protein
MWLSVCSNIAQPSQGEPAELDTPASPSVNSSHAMAVSLSSLPHPDDPSECASSNRIVHL